MKISDMLLNVFVKVGGKILTKDQMCYILGLKLGVRPTFSNDGDSKSTFVVASCHPLNSITWHWSLWWTKPLKVDFNWVKCGCGFRLHKQQLMIRK
jgi:hypothetical protein